MLVEVAHHRIVVVLVVALMGSAMAGCLQAETGEADDASLPGDATDAEPGDADAEGDAGEAEEKEGTSHLWDEDVPAVRGFIANPDVTGPGGDSYYVGTATIGDDDLGSDVDAFDAFVVHVDEVVLHDEDGAATVHIPVDVELDFLAYEAGDRGEAERIFFAWELEVPVKAYKYVSVKMTPVDIVHEEGGDVMDPPEDHTFEFETGDMVPLMPPHVDASTYEPEEGMAWWPDLLFLATYSERGGQHTVAVETSVYGIHGIDARYHSSSYWGADDDEAEE